MLLLLPLPKDLQWQCQTLHSSARVCGDQGCSLHKLFASVLLLGMAGRVGRDGTYSKAHLFPTSYHHIEAHEDILIVTNSSTSVALAFLNNA